MFLPSECWLLIIHRLDNIGFTSLMEWFRERNPTFADNLFGLLCQDIVRSNPRLSIMNDYVKNPKLFQKKANYLNFRLLFLNTRDYQNDVRMCSSGYSNILSYRYYLINYVLSGKEQKIFRNLTFQNGVNYKDEYDNKIHFKNLIVHNNDLYRFIC